MKTISILLALINSLFAGVILLASLTSSDIHAAILLWTLIKIIAALGVIFIGGLTWLGNMISIRSGLTALGSLALVALGAATGVWTFHLAFVSGDMEYYMLFFGGSLMVQGAASLLGSAKESGRMTTS